MSVQETDVREYRVGHSVVMFDRNNPDAWITCGNPYVVG